MVLRVAMIWLLLACGRTARVGPVAAPVAPVIGLPAGVSRPGAPPPSWQLLDADVDGMPGVSAERAYELLRTLGRPSRTVVVAPIDVGVDTTVADLRANLWVSPRESGGTGRDEDGDVMGRGLRNGHGTHLAGVVGAERGNGIGVDGVADNVRIVMIHAPSDGGARVINMSFGKPYSPEKGAGDAAVRHAGAHDVLLVASR